ncbi:MAG: M20/M25/M40 family metallo-hydrolase, partial [Thermoanaerobaculia bacterium]|nr:M20/M25/M40 family metallo-hydrolase [Thermoanaerobaculia bacterium]
MPVDREFTITTLQELVRIDSRNPSSEEGAPGELGIGLEVWKLLDGLGWEAKVQDLGEARVNVVATRRGTGDGPSLMLNVHLDTVGVTGMEDPFSGQLRDGRVFGRGAQDTKGGAAAVLGAAKSLAEDGVRLAGDLVLAFVADEEHESLGTAALVREVKTDAAIVLEPSDLEVCVAHRGFGIYRLTTRGRTAHGGRPEIGIDANLHMAHLLAELDRLNPWSRDGHHHPLLGSASFHVPRIAGGRQLFVYSDRCTADLVCRTVPGQSQESVLEEIRGIVEAVAERTEAFDASVEPVLWRSPYEIDSDRPIVRVVRETVEDVLER